MSLAGPGPANLPKSPGILPFREEASRALLKLRYQCDRQYPSLNAAYRLTGRDCIAIQLSRIDHIRNLTTEYTQLYQPSGSGYTKHGAELLNDNIYKIRDIASGDIVCGFCDIRKDALGVYAYYPSQDLDANEVIDAFEIPIGSIHRFPLVKHQRFYPPYAVTKDGGLYIVYLAEPISDLDESSKWMEACNITPLEQALNLGEQSETLRRPQAYVLDVEERRIISISNFSSAVVQATVLNALEPSTRNKLPRPLSYAIFAGDLLSGTQSRSSSNAADLSLREDDRRALECTPHVRGDPLEETAAPLVYIDVLISYLHPKHAHLGIVYHPGRALLHSVIRVEMISGTILGSTPILADTFCVRDFFSISAMQNQSNDMSRYALLCLDYPDVGEHCFSCRAKLLTFNINVHEATGVLTAPMMGADDVTPDNRTCDTKDSSIGLEITQSVLTDWQCVDNQFETNQSKGLFVSNDFRMSAETIDRDQKSGWLVYLDRGQTRIAVFKYSSDPSGECVQWSSTGRIPYPTTIRLFLDKADFTVKVSSNQSYQLISLDHLSPCVLEQSEAKQLFHNALYGASFLKTSDPSNSVICYRRRKLPPRGVTAAMLFIHGGPNSMASISFGNSAFLNFIFAATAVDLIVVPNYPGSIGYSDLYTKSLAGHCGETDVQWCLRALFDALCDEFGISARASSEKCLSFSEETWPFSHVSCIAYGGSHGGFITGHLVCSPGGIFKAGIMLNPVTDASMHTTDIPDWACYQMAEVKYSIKGLTPDWSTIRNRQFLQSPISKVASISCPILMLLGQKDKRVDWHQGRNFYLRVRELERQNKFTLVPSRCIVYKESNHSLSEPTILFHKDVETAKFINQVLHAQHFNAGSQQRVNLTHPI